MNRTADVDAVKPDAENLKIAVLMHLFHIDLMHEMMMYVQSVQKVFPTATVIITVPLEKNIIELHQQIQKLISNFHVISVKNIGVDIYAFIVQVQYMRLKGIRADFILKLHTKKSITPDGANWRKVLIKPLVSFQNLLHLKQLFIEDKQRTLNAQFLPSVSQNGVLWRLPTNGTWTSTDWKSSFGFAAVEKHICSIEMDQRHYPQNLTGIQKLHDRFGFIHAEYSHFVGGTMFWISGAVIDEMLTDELIKYVTKKFCHGKPPNNNFTDSNCIEYVLERVLSGCFCTQKTNVILN